MDRFLLRMSTNYVSKSAGLTDASATSLINGVIFHFVTY